MIQKLPAINYDPSQVGRLLMKLGWSRQKLQTKARQQDALAVAQWRQERLPSLKKAQAEGRVIAFLDESAFCLLSLFAHTWAPFG